MTNDFSNRPGPAAYGLVSLLGVILFVLPPFWRGWGFIDHVDAPLQSGGVFSQSGVMDVLASRVGEVYRPVADLSYLLDHSLAARPTGLALFMQVQSGAWHVLAALALLLFLGGLGLGRYRSLVGAALFLVHPASAETVSVAAFRPAILAGLFSFLCLEAVRRFGPEARVAPGVAAGVFALLAAAASPLAFILPLLALAVGRRNGGRGTAGCVVVAVPVLSLLALNWNTLTGFDPSRCAEPALAFVAWRPAAMAMDPRLASVPLAGLAVPFVLAVLVRILRRRQPGVALGLTLVAVACVASACATPVTPDYPMYAAVAGASLALAALPLPARLHGFLALPAAVALGVVTWFATGLYRDSVGLWRSAADRSPSAAILLARELAESTTDSDRREASVLLRANVARLPEGENRLDGLEFLIDVLARQGDDAEAGAAAEELCELADRLRELPDGVQRLVQSYLIATECFARLQDGARTASYLDKARALAPDHADVIAADATAVFGELLRTEQLARPEEGVGGEPGWLAADDPRAEPIEAQLDRALARDETCYPALLLAGRVAEAKGLVLTASKYFEQASVGDPRRSEPYLLLAKLYLQTEMPDNAQEVLQRALLEGIDEPRLHFWLALTHQYRGDARTARQYLELYLEVRPDNQEARALLANMLAGEALNLEDQIEPEELQARAKRIRELNPDDPKGYLVQAAAYSRDRDYLSAIVFLDRAREVMPEDADVVRRLAIAHKNHGYLLVLTQERELAMDHFRTFLSLEAAGEPTDAVRNVLEAHCASLETEARALLDAGDGAAAESGFRRSIELLPTRPRPHHFMGLALMFQKRQEESLSSFEAAVRLGEARGEDVSLSVLALLDTLLDLDRADEAKSRGREYLARVGDAADPKFLEMIRVIVGGFWIAEVAHR